MRMTCNGKTDMGYIRFTDYEDDDVAKWDLVAGHGIEGMFTLDFDKRGRLLGFEVRLASMAMPAGFWDDAERV